MPDDLMAGWRLWATDRAGRIYEVLKSPQQGVTTPGAYLLGDDEVRAIERELSSDSLLTIVARDYIDLDMLQARRVTLHATQATGEAAYYIDCIAFVAMVVDPATAASHGQDS